MKKRVLTASAVVCTLSVLSMICLGQIEKNRSISPLAAANVEALTGDETPLLRVCFETLYTTSYEEGKLNVEVRNCSDCKWYYIDSCKVSGTCWK